jgi:hypothetical protein
MTHIIQISGLCMGVKLMDQMKGSGTLLEKNQPTT